MRNASSPLRGKSASYSFMIGDISFIKLTAAIPGALEEPLNVQEARFPEPQFITLKPPFLPR